MSGTPEVTGKVVWESADGRQVRGVRQITPGVVTDTEADEMFVVLSGSATIEVEGGPTLTVGPGDLAVLREGDRYDVDGARDAAQGGVRDQHRLAPAGRRPRPDVLGPPRP